MKKLRLMILLAIFCLNDEGVSIVKDKFSNDIIGISWTPKKDFTIEIYLKRTGPLRKFILAQIVQKRHHVTRAY
jgi:hypothetical protein